MSKLSINNQTELLQNKNYYNFTKEKNKLKSQYDIRLWAHGSGNISNIDRDWFMTEGRKQWREYLSKVSELIFKPNSDFQGFVWDIISEREKEERAFKCRARLK